MSQNEEIKKTEDSQEVPQSTLIVDAAKDLGPFGSFPLSIRSGSSATPASGMVGVTASSTRQVEPMTVAERVAMWYVAPLEAMADEHHGFAILSLTFPLLERWLRSKGHFADNDKFHQSHAVWSVVAGILGSDEDSCYRFWNLYRNGLLHRAAAKDSVSVKTAIVRDEPYCLKRDGDQLWVNPFKIRAEVVKLVKADPSIWNDPDYPLAEVLRVK